MTSGNPFSEEEMRKLEQMLKSGLDLRQCAYFLNRTRNSVKAHVARGGGVKNYSPLRFQGAKESGREKQRAAVTAHFTEEEKKKILEMKANGKPKSYIASVMQCGRKRVSRFLEEDAHPKGRAAGVLEYTRSIKERIYALEQQIEIVFEMIGKLQGEK